MHKIKSIFYMLFYTIGFPFAILSYNYSVGKWRLKMHQKDVAELIDKELNSHGPKIQYKSIHVVPKDIGKYESYIVGNDHA